MGLYQPNRICNMLSTPITASLECCIDDVYALDGQDIPRIKQPFHFTCHRRDLRCIAFCAAFFKRTAGRGRRGEDDQVQKRADDVSQFALSKKKGLQSGERKMRRLVLDDCSKGNGSAGVEERGKNDLDVCLRSDGNSEEGEVTFTPRSTK